MSCRARARVERQRAAQTNASNGKQLSCHGNGASAKQSGAHPAARHTCDEAHTPKLHRIADLLHFQAAGHECPARTELLRACMAQLVAACQLEAWRTCPDTLTNPPQNPTLHPPLALGLPPPPLLEPQPAAAAAAAAHPCCHSPGPPPVAAFAAFAKDLSSRVPATHAGEQWRVLQFRQAHPASQLLQGVAICPNHSEAL